jgi:TonB family protein
MPMHLLRTVALSLTALACTAAPLCAQQQASPSSGGKIFIPEEKMAGHCTTMVSPLYPAGAPPHEDVVILRVSVLRTGVVTPLRIVSGPREFEFSAMNAARLWKFDPYLRDGEPIDVVTELHILFTPGRPGGIVTHPHPPH